MDLVHHCLAPLCDATADADRDFGLPPCTAAKFLLIVFLHVLLFACLRRRAAKLPPQPFTQHSLLRFAEDEPLPTASPQASASGSGLSGATGLRRR